MERIPSSWKSLDFLYSLFSSGSVNASNRFMSESPFNMGFNNVYFIILGRKANNPIARLTDITIKDLHIRFSARIN